MGAGFLNGESRNGGGCEISGFFGVSAMVAISVWRRLSRTSQIPFGGEPKHLLWALLFMEVYPKEGIVCKLINIKDPKRFRGRVKALSKPLRI